jgi:hypothetical protein
MKSTSSIIPAQESVVSIVPKPTQAQIIRAMAMELAKQNEARNKITEAAKKKLDSKIKAEVTKLAKAQARSAISIRNTSYWKWQKDVSADVTFPVKLTPEVIKMIEAHEKMETLSTHPEVLYQEIKAKIQEEMISMIAEQPGMKNVINSTLRAIGLAE